MSDRIRVYIAGPISRGDLASNIKQADQAFVRLLKAGFAPMCPHWSCYCGGPYDGPTPQVLPVGTTHDDWYGVDLPWVAVSDAVLRLPGESTGADLEVAKAKEMGIPVYSDIEYLLSNPPPAGDPEYLAILTEMRQMHRRKGADYGKGEDVFANVRNGESIGIPAWKAAYLRSKDKAVRIDNFCLTGTLVNEGVEDSFLDNAAYNLIALRLFREDSRKSA